MQPITSYISPTRSRALVVVALIVGLAVLSVMSARLVLAHEAREVGSFKLDVGFINEPAYEGMLNGVVLTVTRATATESAEHADDADGEDMHTHEDDDHSHGDEDSDEDADPAAADALALAFASEVMAHGAHFHSPTLNQGTTFHFEITEDLRGLDVPYHIHPGDFEGVISVGQDDGDGSEFAVDVSSDGLSDGMVNVGVGDTVAWSNNTDFAAAVMSGPLSSMTDELADADGMMMAMEKGEAGDPVTGLASALQVDVSHLATGGLVTLAFRESETVPGRYEAAFIPTAVGEYEFRIFGDIEGEQIDEVFTAGPETFDTVESADAIQFPTSFRSARQLENAVRGAQDEATLATDEARRGSNSANIALGLAIVAVLAGIVGAALGGYGFLVTRNREASS